jgi:hypothetical protein
MSVNYIGIWTVSVFTPLTVILLQPSQNQNCKYSCCKQIKTRMGLVCTRSILYFISL